MNSFDELWTEYVRTHAEFQDKINLVEYLCDHALETDQEKKFFPRIMELFLEVKALELVLTDLENRVENALDN